MKIRLLDIEGKEKATKELPKQFKEDIRPNLILRAVLAIKSHKRQKYGSDSRAGKKVSAQVSKRRKKYRGCYGFGISRVPRKILSRRGTRMNWVGALVPGTVGGRRAHPPKAEKNWEQKINKKEKRKAIRSAISATINKELVEKRGHKVPNNYPFIIDSKIQEINKTKEVKKLLVKLGLKEELKRASSKKIRAGKGKLRGRKYKKKTGPLIVVSEDCKLTKSVRNIPGCNIISVKNLNADILAPGANVGRLTIFSEDAINKMEKEKLFL